MRRAIVGLGWGTLVAVLAYGAWLAIVDFNQVRDHLSRTSWTPFAAALGLSVGNYLLRFVKWELCLGWLGVRQHSPKLSRLRSLAVYIAGLSMTITPGKLGEAIRSVLLQRSHGIPIARTAPIVVADRLSDVLALVLLCAAGALRFEAFAPLLGLVALVAVGSVSIFAHRATAERIVRWLQRRRRGQRWADALQDAVASTQALMGLRGVGLLTALSVVGWGLECVGFWLILQGFGLAAALPDAVFLWSMGTLVGAVSFLPGGLGATEGSITAVALRVVARATEASLSAAVLLGRLATLWFGQLLGLVALALVVLAQRRRSSAQTP